MSTVFAGVDSASHFVSFGNSAFDESDTQV